MQRHVQQEIVNLQCPVVRDETELAELVHEHAHARPGGTDHLCKWSVLRDVDSGDDWLRSLE